MGHLYHGELFNNQRLHGNSMFLGSEIAYPGLNRCKWEMIKIYNAIPIRIRPRKKNLGWKTHMKLCILSYHQKHPVKHSTSHKNQDNPIKAR
jgi:hypothetical protein